MKLIQKIKQILSQPRILEIVLYLFFGVLTTIVNFVVYFVVRDMFGANIIVSNTLAWVLSVLFAFVTNKIWVFRSKTTKLTDLIKEAASFVFYRLVSFGMDMGTMLLLVEVFGINEFLSKIATQFIVVVANYVFSKLFIFNRSKNNSHQIQDRGR